MSNRFIGSGGGAPVMIHDTLSVAQGGNGGGLGGASSGGGGGAEERVERLGGGTEPRATVAEDA